MNFSEKLKKLRKEHNNVTHKQLSEATGISVASISSYEQGRRKPKLEQLISFANFFNVPVSYLQNDDIDLNEAEQSTVRNINPEIINRFSQFCLNVDETTLHNIHTLLLTLIKIYDSPNLTLDQKHTAIDALAQLCGFTGEYINKNVSKKILSKYFLDSLKVLIETKDENSIQDELTNYITSNFNQLNTKGLQRLSDYSDDLIGNPAYVKIAAETPTFSKAIKAARSTDDKPIEIVERDESKFINTPAKKL